ncbi:MAG: SufS family cysteine desulfurase [Planctomycetes bacterium]|nr:SufS family cysteine desulfurase [Planctomycetota bacterium]
MSARPLDVAAIRRDFPILSTEVNGRPLVYLDSAATSQKPRQVIDALTDFYSTSCANVHRSVHHLAERATNKFEGARARVARFVNVATPEQIIWTRGTTESINLVANAWGDRNLAAGDVVLLTEMDHHANLVPWHLLAKRRGVKLQFVPVLDDGKLDLEFAHARLADDGPDRPKLFAFTAKSNVLGTENPVADLCRRAHAAGIVTVVDGAQSLPHGPVDVAALGCDFLAFSAHKALGPMGVGCLVVGRPALYERMDPWQGGGEMIRRVRLEDSTYADPPLRFEAGTPSAADAIAFAAALDYLEALDPVAIHEHEVRLTALALDLLRPMGLRILGTDDPAQRAGIVAFDVPDVHPHDVATLLDGRGIAVRAGHHCAQPLMRRFGVQATTRASFYLYNTEDEVRALAEGLAAAMEYFRR